MTVTGTIAVRAGKTSHFSGKNSQPPTPNSQGEADLKVGLYVVRNKFPWKLGVGNWELVCTASTLRVEVAIGLRLAREHKPMKIVEVESEARKTKASAQAAERKFKDAARKVKGLKEQARQAKLQLKRAKKDSKRAAGSPKDAAQLRRTGGYSAA